ncbi:MAG: radical SAM protein, partial [Desulfovermiculus sp.]|nr:radical SAM protein [Desulfovermiculus sp.]
CAMYKTEKFEKRPVEEIKADIDAMAAICDEIKEISLRHGASGISRGAVIEFLGRHPELEDHPGFSMLLSWLVSGGGTAFLQDANTMIMKTQDLVEALQHLRRKFPSIKRVTTYARSGTIARKTPEELQSIRDAGLDRLHIGLESGDDELLKRIHKGADSEVHIKGGRKAVEAGFQVSEYWMPGLGGEDRWESHARETARVLNQINPHYIRSRPFRPLPGTPMYEEYQEGTLRLLTPAEQLQELRLTMQNLEVTSRVCFDHMANYWRGRSGGLLFTHDYEGYKFPEQKEHVLALIEDGLQYGQKEPSFLGL